MGSGRGVHARAESRSTGGTISFGERFAASDQFDAIFREGMALVERSAAYLDGPGRREAKTLPAPAAMLYANESMRLTQRLLQLASWLMIRRDHKEGKIGADVMRCKLASVSLTEPGRISHVRGFDSLPDGLRALISASFALNDRIVRLDLAMQVRTGVQAGVQTGVQMGGAPDAEATGTPAAGASPVQAQVARLERAFSGRPRLRAVQTGS
jgi:regulator of CtrA degradation